MKRIDLANYIVIIGLILFFLLLIWSHYWNGPVVEGALNYSRRQSQSNEIARFQDAAAQKEEESAQKEEEAAPAQKTTAPAPAPPAPPTSKSTYQTIVNLDDRRVFENMYKAKIIEIIGLIDNAYGSNSNKVYNDTDNVISETEINKDLDKDSLLTRHTLSAGIPDFQDELITKMGEYLDGRKAFMGKLNEDISNLNNVISESANKTSDAIITLTKAQEKETKILDTIKNTKKQLYDYAQRLTNIINKIPNKIPEDISIGVIALVPDISDADIRINTNSGTEINPKPPSYLKLKNNFPAFDTYKDLIFTSGKWVINMLIPKNPKGDIGPSGADGAKGGEGEKGIGGETGYRGVWGPPPT